MMRIGVLVLLQMLHSVESAKAPKGSSLNLGDATLLVLDGLADEGMKLANEVLAKEGTDVNLEVEYDDGSKGSPLAVAIHSTGKPDAEDCMDLINKLLAHKDIDVNKPLIAPDGSAVPPLMLAVKAVTAGSKIGVEIAKGLLANEKIAVNAMSSGGKAKLASLHLALAAAAKGAAGGMEVTRALLGRSDIDADVEMVGPDGKAMTPLMKLATMLKESPSDANLQAAVALLRGRAKALEDPELQSLVAGAKGKDEL